MFGRRSWRWKYRNSSCGLKSAVVSRGPRSRPMTFIPALPSSAARIPPAAPTPTMTTSVFSVAMAYPPSPLGLRLQADDGRAVGLPALHVLRREQRLRAREADQSPAGEVPVAAIDRVGKHSFHRVRADGVEERLRTGPHELGGFALLERRDHFVLACGVQLDERRLVGADTIRIER